MFTTLVTKILAAILKKAAILAGLRTIADGFTIFSWFETARSLHECKELPRCIVEVSYDVLVDRGVDELVDRVIDNRFDVHRTGAGLYVASAKPILQPTIVYPSLDEWQSSAFSEQFASEWEHRAAGFMSALDRKRQVFSNDLTRRRGR